mmetsp:Transcript_463/g.937  ORF Transcript_463/g.937 Transcript_463/m.937 type:complete len:605 (+) Transcript_463:32-1846(+)
MARRPDNTRGQLVFQEGKCVKSAEGEEKNYYIIGVYDDPGSCTVTFAAYELESDEQYTLPYTYTELDDVFRHNSELMNPNNADARYHYVIERLDFVFDDARRKRLVLAPEPTPDPAQEEEVQAKVQPALRKTAAGGSKKLDQNTRAKLLKELDTHNDNQLQFVLVKSEEARSKFLSELHSKRRLEQLKATQRIIKMDEDRSDRLARLAAAKKLRADKALQFQEAKEKRQKTLAALDTMMKGKDEEAIKKLLEQKQQEEAELQERLGEASQKKQAELMSLREQKEEVMRRIHVVEAKRLQNIRRRMELEKVHLESILTKRHRALEEERRAKQVLQEKKTDIMFKQRELKIEAAQAKREKKEMWEKLEDFRMRAELSREKSRRVAEHAKVIDMKREQEKEDRDRLLRREAVLRQRVEDSRAVRRKRQDTRLQQEELEEQRNMHINIRAAQRAEQHKLKSWYTDRDVDPDDPEAIRKEKFVAEVGRTERREAREAGHDQAAKKQTEKILTSERYRRQEEVRKYQEWKDKENQRISGLEQKRVARDEQARAAALRESQNGVLRSEKWTQLQQVRELKWDERDLLRHEQCLARVQSRHAASGLPLVSVM